MAHLDLEPILREATQKQLRMFEEEIRQLREQAWREGYAHAGTGDYFEDNPYSKENWDARDSQVSRDGDS
jgi:hypothetical protein